MSKRSEQLYNDPWDRDSYETGSTRPPKNHGGLVAFLLVIIIVLGGVITGLGIMNIRLFQMLTVAQRTQQQSLVEMPYEGATVPSVGETTATGPILESEEEDHAQLGLACVSVSDFDSRFYRLPYGCLVMEVKEGSCAETAGLLSGDVILKLNDRDITSVDDLRLALENCSAGESVSVRVYRSRTGKYVTLAVTLDKAAQ